MRVTVAASRNARMGRSSEREADERTVRCAARQSEALARAGSGRTSGEDVQALAEPARLFAHHEEPAVAREFARFCWDLATSRDPTRERSSAAPCIYTEVVAQLQTNVAIGLRRGRDHRSLGHVAVSARASPSSTCAAFLAVRPRHCCGGSAAPGLHAPGGAYPTMRRQMRTRTTSPALRGLLATVLFATGCHESVSPRRGRQGPEFWEVPAQALAFTVQPNNSTPCPSTIAPPVEVTAVDNQGQAVPDFTGDVTIAIGHDASAAGNATLSGTKTVAAVNGVARFGDLCIDQVGSGYMLQATSPGLTDATSTAFDITAAPPTTGDLIVTTTTTGSNLPTGYTVAVDDRPTQAIGANDHVTFSTLAAGDHSVTLVGVPSNCTVNEANPQKVSVPAGGTGHADFTIDYVGRAPWRGGLVVTTATTGSNLPAGYTVMVDNGQPKGSGTTGQVTYAGLARRHHGDHGLEPARRLHGHGGQWPATKHRHNRERDLPRSRRGRPHATAERAVQLHGERGEPPDGNGARRWHGARGLHDRLRADDGRARRHHRDHRREPASRLHGHRGRSPPGHRHPRSHDLPCARGGSPLGRVGRGVQLHGERRERPDGVGARDRKSV